MAKKTVNDYKGVLIVVAGLLLFGLVALTSATGPTGFQRFGDTYYFLKRQLLTGILPGIVLFLVFSKIPLRIYRKAAPWLLPVSVILLSLGFIPGLRADYGSGSWITIFGQSFQPSEPVKLLVIIYFAWWLARRGTKYIREFWTGLLPFMIVVGIFMGVMMLQSDLGTTSVFVAIFFSMYIAAGAPWRHLAIVTTGGMVLFYILIKIAPYRADRLKIFLRPDLDPQGVGYHINQALLAVGSGGWLGLGLGKSRQKFLYLPEVASDSIFAVVAEELGFVISALVIAAFVYLIWLGLRIAERAEDDFGRFIAVGIVAWFGFQAILNISAMVGLMPLTGVPLPFISHGGSAMLANLAAVGTLVAVAKGSGGRKRR